MRVNLEEWKEWQQRCFVFGCKIKVSVFFFFWCLPSFRSPNHRLCPWWRCFLHYAGERSVPFCCWTLWHQPFPQECPRAIERAVQREVRRKVEKFEHKQTQNPLTFFEKIPVFPLPQHLPFLFLENYPPFSIRTSMIARAMPSGSSLWCDTQSKKQQN